MNHVGSLGSESSSYPWCASSNAVLSGYAARATSQIPTIACGFTLE